MVIDTHGSVAEEKNKIRIKIKKWHVAAGDWVVHCGRRGGGSHHIGNRRQGQKQHHQPLPDLP